VGFESESVDDVCYQIKGDVNSRKKKSMKESKERIDKVCLQIVIEEKTPKSAIRSLASMAE
jgi:hypothetical protein